MEKKQTPTPWEVDALGYLRGPNGEHILEIQENCFFVLKCVNNFDALLEALKEISKGAGAYSRDPLEHAANCIDDMKAIALKAISEASKP